MEQTERGARSEPRAHARAPITAMYNERRRIARSLRSRRRRVSPRALRIRASVACIHAMKVAVLLLGSLLIVAVLLPKRGSGLAMCLPASHAG